MGAVDGIALRLVERSDVPRLHESLRALSHDLGDAHVAGVDELMQAAFGPAPVLRAQLAEIGPGPLWGVAVYSPAFSTTRGAAGAYVSDLWVSPRARGAGLGQRLLGAVAQDAALHWRAGFIRLTVYDDNPAAQRFYARLGFVPARGETVFTLGREGMVALGPGRDDQRVGISPK